MQYICTAFSTIGTRIRPLLIGLFGTTGLMQGIVQQLIKNETFERAILGIFKSGGALKGSLGRRVPPKPPTSTELKLFISLFFSLPCLRRPGNLLFSDPNSFYFTFGIIKLFLN